MSAELGDSSWSWPQERSCPESHRWGASEIRSGPPENISQVILKLELERVPDPAGRTGPEDKVTLNKLETRYYPGSNLGKASKLSGRLDGAHKNVGFPWLEDFLKSDKLEPSIIATLLKPNIDAKYPKQLKAQKNRARSSSN